MIKPYQYNANFIANYDGDTITVDIQLGFGIVLKDQKLRLYGINAPEIKGASRKDGLKAQLYLNSIITPTLTIKTYKDKKEKYGRWLADVYNDKGEHLNAMMIESGNAEINYYDNEL